MIVCYNQNCVWRREYVIFEKENFLPEKFLKHADEYPVEYIKQYCSNPDVSEHESSLHGNYSAPVRDDELLDWIKDRWLPELKGIFLGDDLEHDHHYVNYHMDEPGSWLETHNDLKNFRWLITSQIYLNSSQGAIVNDYEIKCQRNYFYSINASPFSWHWVPELVKQKQSILFRVGQKRHRTVLNYNHDEPAWLIVNNGHSDRHYAKIGPRMGNLTEAWLVHKGKSNIYHTDWRADHSNTQYQLMQRHKEVNVVHSGEFIGLGQVTVTDENIDAIAHEIFNPGSGIISQTEAVMKDHYHNRLHLNYRGIKL